MRAAFFGTPMAAVPSLAALAAVADVALVVTRPDKAKGRSKRLVASPVKEAALDWGFPVAQPTRAGDLTAELGRGAFDVAVVTAYGQLLPAELLTSTRCGFVNVHFSLLPRWRGAAPVQHALLAGDGSTGVSLMVMDAGLDTGPVLATAEIAIRATDTAGVLTARLAADGAHLLAERLPRFVAGELEPIAQDDAAATPAPKVTVDQARLDPAAPAAVIERQVRAFHPRPGAWGMVDDARFKIQAVRPSSGHASQPGLIRTEGGTALLEARDGVLELLIVQPAGRQPMSGEAWANGRHGRPAHLA